MRPTPDPVPPPVATSNTFCAILTHYPHTHTHSYLPGVGDAAKQHLEQLEGSRKLFVAANSLSIAQRQLLYAHDELSMAVLRIMSRGEGEQVCVCVCCTVAAVGLLVDWVTLWCQP